MKNIRIRPSDFPCSLKECPAGLFLFDESLGLKSEYKDPVNNEMEVFVVESGEVFWGGVKTFEERDKLEVIPIEIEGIEDEA